MHAQITTLHFFASEHVQHSRSASLRMTLTKLALPNQNRQRQELWRDNKILLLFDTAPRQGLLQALRSTADQVESTRNEEPMLIAMVGSMIYQQMNRI